MNFNYCLHPRCLWLCVEAAQETQKEAVAACTAFRKNISHSKRLIITNNFNRNSSKHLVQLGGRKHSDVLERSMKKKKRKKENPKIKASQNIPEPQASIVCVPQLL